MKAATRTERILPFTPDRIYAAFADGPALATWWGPSGFTNEFAVFEFRNGGQWRFTMVGPNGARYANECTFVALKPGEEVVIRHDCAPFFTLSIRLEPHAKGTRLSWEQEFDEAEVLEAVRHIVVPANEQNIDRLTQVLETTPRD